MIPAILSICGCCAILSLQYLLETKFKMLQRNKIALVTAGEQGVGKNISLRLAAEGINIILTYHTKKEEALEVVEEIKKTGVGAVALELSASQIESFPAFFKNFSETLKKDFNTDHFDYLINNPGAEPDNPFEISAENQSDHLANVQFKGIYFFIQYALNYLNDNSAIVNVSGRLAKTYMPGYSPYTSMKGAIDTLKQFGVKGIRANTIALGAATTRIGLSGAGTPKDIGKVVTFLCSDDARWINAQRIEMGDGVNLS